MEDHSSAVAESALSPDGDRAGGVDAVAGSRVEQLARLVASHIGWDYDLSFQDKRAWVSAGGLLPDGTFLDVNAPYKSDYLDAVRALLQALREPTEEMAAAGFRPAYVRCVEAPAVVFSAMIDAALST